jgi:hypothetical protein
MLTTDQKGAIAETAIAHAATKLGIEVYRPIAEGGRFDMIFSASSSYASSASGGAETAMSSSFVATHVGAHAKDCESASDWPHPKQSASRSALGQGFRVRGYTGATQRGRSSAGRAHAWQA